MPTIFDAFTTYFSQWFGVGSDANFIKLLCVICVTFLFTCILIRPLMYIIGSRDIYKHLITCIIILVTLYAFAVMVLPYTNFYNGGVIDGSEILSSDSEFSAIIP